MNKAFLKAIFIFTIGVTIASCTSDDKSTEVEQKVTKKQVIENYAAIAYANYKQAYDDAVLLEKAVTTFTTTPSEANFIAAKNAWKVSRESYGTTEAYRFANGPIDTGDNGPEALINSWPLDENFIDYVDNNGTSTQDGIINQTLLYPIINKSVLLTISKTESGEKNIAVGYHAIEFLLWGQDLTDPSEKKAGLRPYTDYQQTAAGTAKNQKRRADYLNACADVLTDNLDYLVNQWKVGGDYRKEFLALAEDTALKNMYLGITTLALAELPVERMDVALENADQEDEHSCFSDNTHRDIALNLKGVINVYQGKYGAIDGASLEDLVKQVNETSFTDTAASIKDALAKVAAIQTPFDLAISGGTTSTEGKKVTAGSSAIKVFGKNLLAGATKIGIIVNG